MTASESVDDGVARRPGRLVLDDRVVVGDGPHSALIGVADRAQPRAILRGSERLAVGWGTTSRSALRIAIGGSDQRC
jgi:hypothetical protein